ncbi:AtpZ/AtpI family protein [Rhodobacteraceae bacterium]|nr:AtpZ/AtpI family protein [Paracoccaceae bacterium]
MATADQDRKARLEALDAKLAEKRVLDEPKRHQDEHHSQVQQGWRMVTELVAGLGIGFGMGYGLDLVFGTLPWFLIIFTLLGFVAGVRTMMRTAQEMQAQENSGDLDETERD